MLAKSRIRATLTIPPLADLYRKIKIDEFRKAQAHQSETMAERAAPKYVNYLTPSIFLQSEVKEEKPKSNIIEFTLKVKAGSNAKAQTYKKKVGRFFAGNATDWIEVCEDLEEIWNQNSITAPTDREANVKTLLRADALTAFEASVESARQPVPPAINHAPLKTKMIDDVLNEVAKDIFPHRALEIQKL